MARGPADTIYALSSGRGRAGVAVVRVSGPGARTAIETLTEAPLPAPRQAVLRGIRSTVEGELVDRALVLWFPEPQSATGESVAEFHVHGGTAVIEALFAALAARPGFRLAAAGEFTRRAFDNGKLDLTEVEGLADLIEAETEAQRRQALRQMSGALGALCEDWRGRLLRALAHVEAVIDFPDEEVPDSLIEQARPPLEAIASEIGAFLADRRRGELLRDGLSVAILGAPNAGKSSLLNAIARRDVAIVASSPGTTRDVIEVRLDLGGFPVLLADTAGLRAVGEEEALDPVEVEGIRRSLVRAAEADVRLLVVDGADEARGVPAVADPTLVVANKCDLAEFASPSCDSAVEVLPVSAETGEGLASLLDRLSALAAELMASGEGAVLSRRRHREALERCRDSLQRAFAAGAPELFAEDVRLAARALGEITGRVDVEDILDLVFAEFCIGK